MVGIGAQSCKGVCMSVTEARTPLDGASEKSFGRAVARTRDGAFLYGYFGYGNLGDTSTLADPTVVQDLVTNRMNRG